MERSELQQLVLKHVSRENYRPVKPRVIAKQLNLPRGEHDLLKKVIKKLVKKGQLAYGANHFVELAQKPKPKRNEVTGVFRRAAGGFGFVRPTGTSQRRDDIYISKHKTLDAANGDTVLVRLGRAHPGKDGHKIRGEIVEVLERQTHQFVGTYFERGGFGYVQIDGTVFAQPILVGDAGAKNAQLRDKVVIEMVRFPSPIHDGEGVVVEVLGARGTPGLDTLMIMREFRLPTEFPEHVLESARTEAEQFDEAVGDRLDLTSETVITIDPKDARDFDDAISLQRLENGHWRLGVHIADVSHFVKPGSPLDQEARQRATSVYLPDRVVPMLPEIISNNLASLQPDRVRYTKSAFIEFTSDGARVAAEVHRGAIKSCRRFAYEEVDDYLAAPVNWKQKLTPEVFHLLDQMHKLAMILRRRRLDGGAIELTLPEVKIDLDSQGRVSGAHTVEHTVSHQIIEEFMLAANEAVAEVLRDRQINFLRRVHEPPSRRKLEALTRFVRELGISCDSLESRFEIKRVVEQVANRPESHAVHYAVLRAMQKAVYSPVDEGHYALASKAYCHFTSPIRRYPDLTVHRIFDALTEKKTPDDNFGQLVALGDHCSDREQRAEKAERELIKIKLLDFLSRRIGQQMDAVITGVEEYGLFAQGVELPAEGLIHITSLQDDFYDYDAKSHSLTGRRAGNAYRLGDLIRVEIAHVDVDRRELDYRLVRTSKRTPKKGVKTARSTKRQKATKKKAAKRTKKKAAKKKGAKRKKRS